MLTDDFEHFCLTYQPHVMETSGPLHYPAAAHERTSLHCASCMVIYVLEGTAVCLFTAPSSIPLYQKGAIALLCMMSLLLPSHLSISRFFMSCLVR